MPSKKDLLQQILNVVNNLQGKAVKIMAQLDDLNAAIAAEDVEIGDIQAVITKVDADLVALAAAVKAGATPTDLTAQITKIQAQTASLKTASDQLAAADTAAVPPPATPPPATPA